MERNSDSSSNNSVYLFFDILIHLEIIAKNCRLSSELFEFSQEGWLLYLSILNLIGNLWMRGRGTEDADSELLQGPLIYLSLIYVSSQ